MVRQPQTGRKTVVSLIRLRHEYHCVTVLAHLSLDFPRNLVALVARLFDIARGVRVANEMAGRHLVLQCVIQRLVAQAVKGGDDGVDIVDLTPRVGVDVFDRHGVTIQRHDFLAQIVAQADAQLQQFLIRPNAELFDGEPRAHHRVFGDENDLASALREMDAGVQGAVAAFAVDDDGAPAGFDGVIENLLIAGNGDAAVVRDA